MPPLENSRKMQLADVLDSINIYRKEKKKRTLVKSKALKDLIVGDRSIYQ